MDIALEHAWDLSIKDAISLQRELAARVEISRLDKKIRYIGGIDCAPSVDKASYYAAALIWDLELRQLREYHIARAPLTFPYVPGLLSFREIPAILQAVKKLEQEPDIFIVDGHGIAHPRKIGIASHLGVILDKPTFGCGKSLLFGKYDEPGLVRGETSPLRAKGQIIGSVIRTRTNVKPVIVSVGHKVDLDSITKLTLECSGRFRLPEPTHLADQLVAVKQVKDVIIPILC